MEAPTAIPAQPAPTGAIATQTQVLTPKGTLATQVAPTAPVPVPPMSNPAIVVPVVTFIGVVLTIGFGWWKTKTELKASAEQSTIERQQSRDQKEFDRDHAAEQARKARLTTARREVYLQLIGEMTRASMALSAVVSQKGEELDIQGGFEGLLSAAARVGILGEMETVVKSRELMIEVQELLYKMLPAIVQIRHLKAEQANVDGLYAEEHAIVERFKTILRDAYSRGEVLKEFQHFNETIEFCNQEAKKYRAASAVAQTAHSTALLNYQQRIVAKTGEIADKVNELIGCIRAELELETNAVVLMETTRRMQSSAMTSVNGFREEMRSFDL